MSQEDDEAAFEKALATQIKKAQLRLREKATLLFFGIGEGQLETIIPGKPGVRLVTNGANSFSEITCQGEPEATEPPRPQDRPRDTEEK